MNNHLRPALFRLAPLLLIALSPASMEGQWLFDPIRNAIGSAVVGVGNVITPEPKHWEPEFEPTTYVVPLFKEDGRTPNDGSYQIAIRQREFATAATATKLAEMFDAMAVEAPYAGHDGVVMRLQPARKQWNLAIRGVLIPAGHVAWWFTLQPSSTSGGNDGYWPVFTPDEARMKGGRQLADRFIEMSVQFGPKQISHLLDRPSTLALMGSSTRRGLAVIMAHGPTLPPPPDDWQWCDPYWCVLYPWACCQSGPQ